MSQMMQYKGYEGSVLYSVEDKILHGKLQGIRDFVIYDGKDPEEIEKNFRDAVDEYLAFCAETGKTPNKPFKDSINVRLSEELHVRAARYADEKKMKLNSVINDAVEHYLSHAD